MPHQRTEIIEQKLTGLAEIRQAMDQLEDLRGRGIDAKIEIDDMSSNRCEKILLYSLDDLQKFVSHLFSRLLANEISTSIPLDDFERLVSEITTKLLDDTHTITGRLIP